MKKKPRKLVSLRVDRLKPEAEPPLDESVVTGLMESLRVEGLRVPLQVLGSNHVVSGRHRLEAAKRLGWKVIECIVDEPTETREQHRARVIVENLARKHLDADERRRFTAELVEIRQAQVAPTKTQAVKPPPGAKPPGFSFGPPSKPSGGRPATTGRAEAIRQVARETGRTEKAVKRDLEKVAAERRTQSTPATSPVSDERGTVIPEALRARWELLRSWSEMLDRQLQTAQATMQRLLTEVGATDTSESVWATARVQRWREAVHTVAVELRTDRPFAVCPYCKGANGGCRACERLGFVSRYVFDRAPADLRGAEKSAKAIMDSITEHSADTEAELL